MEEQFASKRKRCHNCKIDLSSVLVNFPNEQEFKFCPYCASPAEIQCSSCNKRFSDPAYLFCPWCGLKFQGK